MILSPDDSPELYEDTYINQQKESVFPLSRVKDYLNLQSEDEIITDLVEAAKGHFEEITGHYIDLQTRRVSFDRYSSRYNVPALPIQSLDTVETVRNGTVESENIDNWFVLSRRPPQIRNKGEGGPTGHDIDAVRFEYTAGYKESGDISETLVNVVKKIANDLYEHPSSTISGDFSVATELQTRWKKLIKPELMNRYDDKQPHFAQNKNHLF